MKTKRWIVQHKSGWCATFRNRKPSEDAISDATVCGNFVVLRIGSKKGTPNCQECRKKLQSK